MTLGLQAIIVTHGRGAFTLERFVHHSPDFVPVNCCDDDHS